MGPLNEFQRRWLDMVQQNIYLQQANAGGPDPEYFGYPLQIGSVSNRLTNGVTQQGVITIQADAWFLWETISSAVVLPTSTAPYGSRREFTDAGNILMQITLPGMGDDLYNIPPGVPGMPAALSTGSPVAAMAGVPYLFPTPVLLPPNTNINISATKLGDETDGNNPDPGGFFVMLHGARVMLWS